MNEILNPQFFIESFAGIFTICGIYFGTTTKLGVVLYSVSVILWWAAMLHGHLWGYWILNSGLTVVTIRNYMKAFR